jgi:DNA-binding HxlR family transcriptional regulator
MPYRAFEDQNCSIARSLAIVGERWTLLVLRDVLLGNRRFEEIRRSLGVASNILADRLATLVEHGILSRDGDPPEYRVTDKGRDLSPVLVALVQWGDKYTAGEAGPPIVHVHTACGHPAHPELHCSACGETIKPGDLRVVPGPGANEAQIAAAEARTARERAAAL